MISTSFGCPYEGEVPPERVFAIAERLAAAGCEEIGFGDTTGMANPVQVGEFFAAARERLGGVELTAHFHNTRGQGLANVLAALEQGIDSFESSFGELGGCPVPPGATGNVSSEDVVSMLHEMGIETGIDLPRLIEASRAAQEALGRPLGAHVLDGRARRLASRRGRIGSRAVTDFAKALEAALAGGPQRHHEKTAEQGKLPVRERVARLVDAGSFAEEALLANWNEEGLGADGVVTGLATIDGRRVALMANDPTVKAGSWGPKTVEKILRIQERALSLQLPMVYLVDSAGARITDQVQMFPGRRGAGRIFHNEVRLSGQVPQVCLLFGPSAAGGAYIPAFCDVVIMREGNASMYLGSPRMAEMVIGEKVTLEEMGGAKMHTGVSGCGHFLVKSDEEAIDLAKRYLSYMPGNWREAAACRRARRAGLRDADRRDRPRRREPALRHARGARRPARRRLASSKSTSAGPKS